MPKSPASPESPVEPEPVPTPWEQDEGAAEAEDIYLNWLQGGRE